MILAKARTGLLALLGQFLVLPCAIAAPLTIAIAELTANSTALIADDQAYFAAEGLDIKVIRCVNGKRCLKHLTDGEAQYATVADTPIMLAVLGGARFDILATTGITSRENRFLARADRGIATAADLKGKRIGVIKGSSAHYFTDTVLLFNGIGTQQVTFVPIEGGDAAAALIRGDVDAAGLYSPVWQKVQSAMGKQIVTIANPNVSTMTTNLVGINRAAGGKQSDAVKLLRALQRADRLIDSDPARARAILAARLKLPASELDATWKDYDFSLSLAQPLIGSLEAQSRWALRENLVPGAKMPDFLDYVDPAPLRALDARAVNITK